MSKKTVHAPSQEKLRASRRAFLKKAPDAPEAIEAGDIVGRGLEERKEYLEAAELYAALAGRDEYRVAVPAVKRPCACARMI